MDFEPNYGSSEYSEKAEEIFAGFLLDVERAQLNPADGEAPDFEEFCAQHDSYADELYGLHADWDNVRGLVAQMNGQRAVAIPAVPAPTVQTEPSAADIAKREAMVEPFSADDVQARDEDRDPAPQGNWKRLASIALGVAVLASAWALRQSRHSVVLASEKAELESSRRATQEELTASRETRQALAARGDELEGELRSTQLAKGQLESSQVDLHRDLDKERAEREELESKRLKLENVLRLEREKNESVVALAEQAKRKAEALALGVQAAELAREEASLWPSTPGMIEPLANWIHRAKELESSLSLLDIGRDLAADANSAPDLFASLFGPGGSLERAVNRIQALKLWQREAEAEAGSVWARALAELGDPLKSPLYAGIDLQPQFGLVPLGPANESGLWRFADRQTGQVTSAVGDGYPQATDALVFVLVPGMELEGRLIAPFFVSERAWDNECHLRAFGLPQEPAATALEQRIGYESDLLRLGYKPLSSLQAMLARPYGVQVTTWGNYPVRSLTQTAQ